MTRDLKWAAKTMMELAKIPVQPNLLNAFINPNGNDQWIKQVIKAASPVVGDTNAALFDQALTILTENGIDTKLYGN